MKAQTFNILPHYLKNNSFFALKLRSLPEEVRNLTISSDGGFPLSKLGILNTESIPLKTCLRLKGGFSTLLLFRDRIFHWHLHFEGFIHNLFWERAQGILFSNGYLLILSLLYSLSYPPYPLFSLAFHVSCRHKRWHQNRNPHLDLTYRNSIQTLRMLWPALSTRQHWVNPPQRYSEVRFYIKGTDILIGFVLSYALHESSDEVEALFIDQELVSLVSHLECKSRPVT